ncbi:MAG: hypothetical protein AAFU61_06035 [Pseudomonadota bacterium]
MPRPITLCHAVALALLAQPSQAVPSYVAATFATAVDADSNQVGLCSDSASDGSVVTCQGAAAFGADVFRYDTAAQAGPTALRLRSRLRATENDPAAATLPSFGTGFQGAISDPSASIDDVWTVTGAPGAATLEFDFLVEGVSDFNGVNDLLGGAPATVPLVVFLATDLNSFASDGWAPTDEFGLQGLPAGAFSDIATVRLPVSNGVPVSARLTFSSGATLSPGAAGYGDAFVSFDFFNTARPDALRVLDASGAPLPFDLTTASGEAIWQDIRTTEPRRPQANVPLPASALLLAGALAALGWRARASA